MYSRSMKGLRTEQTPRSEWNEGERWDGKERDVLVDSDDLDAAHFEGVSEDNTSDTA